jgi:hypothetical protein
MRELVVKATVILHRSAVSRPLKSSVMCRKKVSLL